MTKDRLATWAMNIAVVAMAAAIPFGAVMGFYTNNGNWFWLCAFLLIFLS